MTPVRDLVQVSMALAGDGPRRTWWADLSWFPLDSLWALGNTGDLGLNYLPDLRFGDARRAGDQQEWEEDEEVTHR